MSKKIIRDAVFTSRNVALSEINDALDAFRANFPIEPLDLIVDNLPTVEATAEDGTATAYTGWTPTDAGGIVWDEAIVSQLGTVALVTIYEGEHRPAPDAEPLALPVAIYILNLPKPAEIMGDERLQDYRAELIQRDLLARARKLAKADRAGTTPLIRDRVSALLAAAARTGGSPEKAFDAIFPVLQGLILKNVAAKVEALKNAKQVAKARLVADTFSKSRLNKDTMRDCLSSASAAVLHFPAMPQEQWHTLLRVAITYAPKHRVMKLVKDESGTTIKDTDPDTGKERARREPAPAPQSPAIFQTWLDTRDETTRTPEAVTLDLSDLTPDAA